MSVVGVIGLMWSVSLIGRLNSLVSRTLFGCWVWMFNLGGVHSFLFRVDGWMVVGNFPVGRGSEFLVGSGGSGGGSPEVH